MNSKTHLSSCLHKLKLPVPAMAGLAAACLALSGAPAQAQTITSIFPDGTYQFQNSPTLSFVANSPSGTAASNITVQLSVTSLSGQSFIKHLTSANGLNVTGNPTNLTVTAPLTSNTVYTATIQTTDLGGHAASATVAFDTVAPAFLFEAEDYDYTSNGVTGLHIDTPETNGYRGLAATEGVDTHVVNFQPTQIAYRPSGLNTEVATDKARQSYIGTGFTDYDVGWNDGQNWANYTHAYPPGIYNVYMRGADGNPTQANAASMAVLTGSGSFSGTGPYTYSVPGNGWQTYSWVPLLDSAGSLVQFTSDGSVMTLQTTVVGGNFNANFYVLVPANTNAPVNSITVTNISPDGSVLFQGGATNFSFTATSSNGIDPGNILVQFSVTNLSGVGYITNFDASSGLTVGGTSTNRTVSAPLGSNLVYHAFIQITDGSGNPQSFTATFDTITPAYTFEAEDFNFGGGQTVPEPQVNGYEFQDGVSGIDFNYPSPGMEAYFRVGLSTETCGDTLRTAHAGFQDFDLGNSEGQAWGNYTRTFPTGTYNLYLRAADGNGSSLDSASMALVTSDPMMGNQTISKLGNFDVASTGNWQKYEWVPLKDVAGNLVQITGGAAQTLRFTTDNGNYNANFFLLMPADLSIKILPFTDGFQPDGTSLFQTASQFSFAAHSSPGITTNNIVVTVDGANASGLSFVGSSKNWTVSGPISANAYHTVVISLTDVNGTTSSTNSFGTFSATNYTWEAEDYDYSGGSNMDDNTVGGLYANLASIPDIDNHQQDLGANPFNYRPNSPAPSTTSSGDQSRSKFGSATDYNIGFFGGGSWVNYTHPYPPGTYNVWGRFAEGGSVTHATLSKVLSGYGTTNQVTNYLGTFTAQLSGWSTWEWAPLVDASGHNAKVTLDGTSTTLRLGGSTVPNESEVNVNFLMLVATTPDLKITASVSAGSNFTISIPTVNGTHYQVQYKAHLTDPAWTPLGGLIAGDGTTKTVNDPMSNGSRYYRVQAE